jgi:UDP-N-acetylmuramate dehydrogenase
MNAAWSHIAHRAGVLSNEPMSRHTSWRVGGSADLYFKPSSVHELTAFLASVPAGMPIHWVGLGSNLLVRDGGIRGAVIATSGLPKLLDRVDDERVRAGAGLACMLLARACVRWQLGPAVFFAGIPGTIGGALAMNAGAFGGETWRSVESVETIDRHGTIRSRPREVFAIGYRSVRGVEGEWFLSALFRFAPDAAITMTSLKTMMARRNESQPLGEPSCGSVFRNPPGDFAGRLIEGAGMKGARVGGAIVSQKHANFIVNTGAATAYDIEMLIDTVRAEVAAKFGITLELEVRIVGEPGGAAV